MLDLEHELGAIIDTLNRERIEYALCGGLAMAVHGDAHATTDVSLLVRDDDVQCIRTVLADGETLKLDLLVVTPATEDVWRNREQREWRGIRVNVVSLEDMTRLTSEHLESRPHKRSVDYSARAITMRIRQVSQLRKLCLSLARAKPVESGAKSQTTDNPARQRGD